MRQVPFDYDMMTGTTHTRIDTHTHTHTCLHVGWL